MRVERAPTRSSATLAAKRPNDGGCGREGCGGPASVVEVMAHERALAGALACEVDADDAGGIERVGAVEVPGRRQGGDPAVAPGEGAGKRRSCVAAFVEVSIVLKPTVPPTPLMGECSAEVAPEQTALLDLTLVGAATTVSERPENGAVSVPVGTAIEPSASAPPDAPTVTGEPLKLLNGDPVQKLG